jgi:hypothetical protein
MPLLSRDRMKSSVRCLNQLAVRGSSIDRKLCMAGQKMIYPCHPITEAPHPLNPALPLSLPRHHPPQSACAVIALSVHQPARVVDRALRLH